LLAQLAQSLEADVIRMDKTFDQSF